MYWSNASSKLYFPPNPVIEFLSFLSDSASLYADRRVLNIRKLDGILYKVSWTVHFPRQNADGPILCNQVAFRASAPTNAYKSTQDWMRGTNMRPSIGFRITNMIVWANLALLLGPSKRDGIKLFTPVPFKFKFGLGMYYHIVPYYTIRNFTQYFRRSNLIIWNGNFPPENIQIMEILWTQYD